MTNDEGPKRNPNHEAPAAIQGVGRVEGVKEVEEQMRWEVGVLFEPFDPFDLFDPPVLSSFGFRHSSFPPADSFCPSFRPARRVC